GPARGAPPHARALRNAHRGRTSASSGPYAAPRAANVRTAHAGAPMARVFQHARAMKAAASSGVSALERRIRGSLGARQRLALGGLAIGLACGVAAPALAWVLSIRLESAFVAVASVALVAAGVLVGGQVEAL